MAELQIEVAKLEAMRVTTATFHVAQLEEAANAKQAAILHEREVLVVKEQEWAAAKEAYDSRLKEITDLSATASARHSELEAELQILKIVSLFYSHGAGPEHDA